MPFLIGVGWHLDFLGVELPEGQLLAWCSLEWGVQWVFVAVTPLPSPYGAVAVRVTFEGQPGPGSHRLRKGWDSCLFTQTGEPGITVGVGDPWGHIWSADSSG